jgi:hypothetical protein
MQMAIRHFAVDVIFQSFALTSNDVGSSVLNDRIVANGLSRTSRNICVHGALSIR